MTRSVTYIARLLKVAVSMAEDFTIYPNYESLDENQKKLIQSAEDALEMSYSPYSNFTVGAALQLQDGKVILGANQENASYPAGLCAERVALFQKGIVAPKEKIELLAVIAKKRGEDEFRSAGPCGMCRQVMVEFEQAQEQPMKVLFKGEGMTWVLALSSNALMPFSFGKENLG